jgi:hypothetical protein
MSDSGESLYNKEFITVSTIWLVPWRAANCGEEFRGFPLL